jgi:hypothetical protein
MDRGKDVMRKALSVLIMGVGFGGQFARTDEVNRFDRQLTSVLRWEILWNDSPNGFHIPRHESAKVAIDLKSNLLSYCSHDLKVCARYRIEPNRNWQRDAVGKCEGKQSDEDAVRTFTGDSVQPKRDSQRKLAIGGIGGLTGSPAVGSGIRWTTTVRLGSRDEIVQQYKRLHPAEIESLTRWIRSSMNPSRGHISITIACFAPTDPMVYYYVDRAAKDSVVMGVVWDREREEWVVASSLLRSRNPSAFEEMHRIIESVACDTITSE